MRRAIAIGLFLNGALLGGFLLPGDAIVHAGGGGDGVHVENGDMNGDGQIDIADVAYFLASLFLGGPPPVAVEGPPAGGKGLLATGQTECHDESGDGVACDAASCPGQDGVYRMGCPSEGRFNDNGDGTVTDSCTGLMWQKDSADVSGDGQLMENQDSLPWCEALTYCENLEFAGQDDWRLPNIRELESILDYRRNRPTIDPVFNTFPSGYWSSTTNAGSTAFAMFVHFDGGLVFDVFKDFPFHVRAVRTAQVAGPPAVEKCTSRAGDVNADGTVDLSDAVTILGYLFLGDPAELVGFCKQPATPTALPDTGQDVCYDFRADVGWFVSPCDESECPGQDGFYATGCPIDDRFKVNGDDTVTDTCTGLEWQETVGDLNGDGTINESDTLIWCDALTYCEDLYFADHDDWRLPNIRELESLVDYGRSGPALDPVFGTFIGLCWSSTSTIGQPGFAWAINFYWGYVGFHDLPVSGNRYVRAVRNTP